MAVSRKRNANWSKHCARSRRQRKRPEIPSGGPKCPRDEQEKWVCSAGRTSSVYPHPVHSGCSRYHLHPRQHLCLESDPRKQKYQQIKARSYTISECRPQYFYLTQESKETHFSLFRLLCENYKIFENENAINGISMAPTSCALSYSTIRCLIFVFLWQQPQWNPISLSFINSIPCLWLNWTSKLAVALVQYRSETYILTEVSTCIFVHPWYLWNQKFKLFFQDVVFFIINLKIF